MSSCPVCGFSYPEDATECGRCHLSASLFDAVREAAGDAGSDPQYVRAVSELLSAVESEPAGEPEEPGAGVLSPAGRFPPLRAGGRPDLPPPPPPAALGLPALPPAGDVPILLRQVNDYLQVGRRQGVDLARFAEQVQSAAGARDRDSLEVLARDLFVHLAAALTEEYDSVVARRNELSALVPTASPDVELEACRAALGMGDLSGAQRRLRHIEQELGELEDQWATVQILIAECDLMAATCRELGADPEPALGPLAEGRRLAHAGQRTAAEPVLARAAVALWAVLSPRFVAELARIKDALLRERAAGTDVGPSVHELRGLALELKHRNFAAAIAAYRRLRGILDGPIPSLAPGPDDAAASPGAPRGSA